MTPKKGAIGSEDNNNNLVRISSLLQKQITITIILNYLSALILKYFHLILLSTAVTIMTFPLPTITIITTTIIEISSLEVTRI